MSSSNDREKTMSEQTGDLRRHSIADAIADGRTVNDPGFVTRPEIDLARGTAVGEYVIEAPIGRGGFGTVYRAVQPLIGKRVGIKVLSRKYSVDAETVSRFIAEARAVNQIRHRHIIDIFSFGQLADGRHYYVMEHLEGVALDRHLAKHAPMTLDAALPVLRAVARALDAAHMKGIAHRDLKPANVFLARDGDGELFPKLLDFGIAKLSDPDEQLGHRTGTGVPIGTPYYMSPEQARGRDVDHRTDIYSFGVLAFRMLTGTYPFDGAMIDVLHKHIHDEAPRASSRNAALSPACDHAIAWMMQKDPDHRPPTALAAVVALQDEGATGSPSPVQSLRQAAPLATPLDAQPPAPRRVRWIVPLVVLLLGGGALGAVAALLELEREREREPAIASHARDSIAAVPVAPAPAVEPVTPDAVVDAEWPYVIVTIQGAPPATDVSIAGTFVGSAPGPVQLPRGRDPVVLVFKTEGYLSVSAPITPDREQTVSVRMKKRPRESLAPAARPDDGRGTLAEPFRKGGN